MISKVLVFLKNQLNAHLRVQSGTLPGASVEDKVVFIEDDKMDPISFKVGAVSALLINIEEEKKLRPPNRYSRTATNGDPQRVQPEIHLNLYVLFAVRFNQYEQGLSYLSLIIRYFQNHRVFNHQNSPDLSDDIEQLVMELITMPLSEQNDLWNALRTTYHPSVLYKVQMVVVRDEEAVATPPVKDAKRDIGRSP